MYEGADFHERHREAATCFVSFASMGEGDPAGCHFEWGRSLDRVNAGLIMIRDPRYRWYQEGVRGIGDIDAVVVYLRKLGERYDRVIPIGLSMGGFGALMFGRLAGLREIIAMSPQTFCDQRINPDEGRWRENWRDLVPVIPDLKPLFPAEAGVRIFLGLDHPHAELDQFHAARCAGAELTELPDHDHSSVGRHLRNTGYFDRLAECES